jgi:cation diffusion facilitator CzcD-associated flavoprotein CzcO
MARSVSTAIIGAGFGGIAAAARLRERGQDDFVILERGERVGGVWNANTYPGIACDVPSQLYSLSFAPNPRWSRRFSQGSEIQAYLEGVVDRLGFRSKLQLNTDVLRATFDEQRGRWILETGNGETVEAEVLVSACGQLTRPSIPNLPGLDRFEGRMFHSAHWPEGEMLDGERVAVVGTGASAIQFAPAIAPHVEHMTVFQRSAPWVIPKPDKPYAHSTKRLYSQLPWLQRIPREAWWAVLEGAVPVFTRRPKAAAIAAALPFRALAEANRAIQLRGEPDLKAKAKPDYPMGCKRLLLTSEWYPMLRRDNVELVTDDITEVVADGVVTADGVHRRVDTIAVGTGFTATEFLAPMEVQGRGGTKLSEAWSDGAEAYLGITVPNFPNMFLLYGPNTNHGTGSALDLLETQSRFVAGAVDMLAQGSAEQLEVRRDVHDEFQRELAERLKHSIWTTCSSWYVTESGRVTNNWPGSQREYRRRVAAVDPADYLTEAELPAPAATTAL